MTNSKDIDRTTNNYKIKERGTYKQPKNLEINTNL